MERFNARFIELGKVQLSFFSNFLSFFVGKEEKGSFSSPIFCNILIIIKRFVYYMKKDDGFVRHLWYTVLNVIITCIIHEYTK